MKPAARLQDKHKCCCTEGPILETGAPTVLLDGLVASKLADHLQCSTHPEDVVKSGAATVLWEQLPATIETSETLVFGEIIPPCSPNVFVGGPMFSVPKSILVNGTWSERNKIVRDLYLLWTTPSGKELFRRLDESGSQVSIYPIPNTEGASAYGSNPYALLFGFGSGSTIYYNPDGGGKPTVFDRNGKGISDPPQIVLAHELNHSLDMAEGTLPAPWTKDPNPPKSEPTIELAESRAIGTGSQTNKYPSENSFRRDLGLAERDNHYGTMDAPGQGPTDLRPGK
jgi:uncharacterized Zn-binding protein involved in type VI secretion